MQGNDWVISKLFPKSGSLDVNYVLLLEIMWNRERDHRPEHRHPIFLKVSRARYIGWSGANRYHFACAHFCPTQSLQIWLPSLSREENLLLLSKKGSSKCGSQAEVIVSSVEPHKILKWWQKKKKKPITFLLKEKPSEVKSCRRLRNNCKKK